MNNRKYNVAVIAGYDVLADRYRPDHKHYVIEAIKRCQREYVEKIFFVGGHTNPDYPDRSEAGANFHIFEVCNGDDFELSPSIEIIPLPMGETSEETLETVRDFCYIHDIAIKKLILCAELSRVIGFAVDAQSVKLVNNISDLNVFGINFANEMDFEKERKKMLLKVLSGRFKFFRFIRKIITKIHIYKTARKVRRGE